MYFHSISCNSYYQDSTWTIWLIYVDFIHANNCIFMSLESEHLISHSLLEGHRAPYFFRSPNEYVVMLIPIIQMSISSLPTSIREMLMVNWACSITSAHVGRITIFYTNTHVYMRKIVPSLLGPTELIVKSIELFNWVSRVYLSLIEEFS